MLPKHVLLDAIASDGSFEVQQAVMDGADGWGLDSDPRSRLVLAKHRKANSLVQPLVRAGTDVDARINSRDDTLLHQALRKENCDFAKALLDEKANCNPKNIKGKTPLHIAAKRGLAFTVKRFLKSDANVYFRTTKGEFPLDLAIAAGYTETAQAIEQVIAARTRFPRDLGDPNFED